MACAGVNGSYRGLSKIDVNALNFVPVWIDMLQAGGTFPPLSIVRYS